MNEWIKFHMQNAGHWIIDPIHNGQNKDFLAYCSYPNDPFSGIFVNILKDGHYILGRYYDARPVITDAEFTVKTQGSKGSYEEAMQHIIENVGCKFLVDLVKAF